MISSTQSRMLNLTAQATEFSPLKYSHACGIFDGHKKLVCGHNHERSTYRGNLMCSFHAEMDACSKLISLLFGGKEPHCLLQAT